MFPKKAIPVKAATPAPMKRSSKRLASGTSRSPSCLKKLKLKLSLGQEAGSSLKSKTSELKKSKSGSTSSSHRSRKPDRTSDRPQLVDEDDLSDSPLSPLDSPRSAPAETQKSPRTRNTPSLDDPVLDSSTVSLSDAEESEEHDDSDLLAEGFPSPCRTHCAT